MFGRNQKSNVITFNVDVWDIRTGTFVTRDFCKAPSWDAVVKHYADMGYTVKSAEGRVKTINSGK